MFALGLQICSLVITRLSLVAFALILASEDAGYSGKLHISPVSAFIEAQVRGWMNDPVIIDALKMQNRTSLVLSDEQILALDREWMAELDRKEQPLISEVLSRPVSEFLKAREAEASGAITEIFVMDARGLNAGASSATSDYWQGDEEKFSRSFMAGPTAVFIDNPRFDESTRLLQSQVTLTLVDGDNQPVGAITVGVNLEYI